MSTEIYYFSGTGNSLHVAKELQKRIPETDLIPIVSLLNTDVIKTSAKTVGFVFPVHALTIPIAVKKFLMKIDLNSAEYIFAVATRYGTIFRGFEKIDQILKKKNKHHTEYGPQRGTTSTERLCCSIPKRAFRNRIGNSGAIGCN